MTSRSDLYCQAFWRTEISKKNEDPSNSQRFSFGLSDREANEGTLFWRDLEKPNWRISFLKGDLDTTVSFLDQIGKDAIYSMKILTNAKK